MSSVLVQNMGHPPAMVGKKWHNWHHLLCLLNLLHACLEYSSLSTNSEESGITSPIYRYEEELDSLSLCSSTSVVDDKDDEIIPTSSDYCPPVSLVLPQASVACVPEISLPTKLISRDAPNKSASLGSLRSTAEVTEKFKRHNIRSSIVKRLTISWKREYDFQLETDKSFAEEGMVMILQSVCGFQSNFGRAKKYICV